MADVDLARLRLRAQRLAGPPLPDPVAVARWLGAVQAQDYAGAAWAIAQRAEGVTAAMIDAALADGALIRTHVLRPTWHLVAPADLRAMLALTAPRVKAAMASFDRQLGLDAALVARSQAVFARALANGARRTREELAADLAAAGIDSKDRLAHLVMHAELDAVVCSGGLRGKRFTYAAFDERVPAGPAFDREAALAALAWRYLEGHGPATVQDLAWWSGLTVADAKAGIAAHGDRLAAIAQEGRTYWHVPGAPEPAAGPVVHLLPNYDELTVAFRDRAAALAPGFAAGRWGPVANVLANVVTVDGRAVGTWKRVVGKAQVVVSADLHVPMDAAGREGLEAAVARYGTFLGVPARLA